MNVPEFISQLDERQPPASEKELLEFEAIIGCRLPDDYRQFLAQANGGVIDDRDDRCYLESADFSVQSVGGIKDLICNRGTYQINERRIPGELLWIMCDAFGRAICIGIKGTYRGKVYLWNNDDEPGSRWDGRVETAGNIQLLADSFTDFISLLPFVEKTKRSGCATLVAVVCFVAITIAAIFTLL